jgi:hypothetical protein
MTKVSFPAYVDEFIQSTEGFLDHFSMKLELTEENTKGQIRSYKLVGSPLKTIFVVHRTQRSLDYEVGEYRTRMLTEAPAKLDELLKDNDAQLNHLATLGALISNESGVEVCAQCLIDPSDSGNLAGLCAASMAQGAQSLIQSQLAILYPKHAANNAVHEISAWGALDFEQIQYDYAHLGTASHSDKEWSIKLNIRHTLTLTAVQNNPFYGGGLLCLLWVPRSEFGNDDGPLPIKTLNDIEHLLGEAPTFGGWCDDGEMYVFTSFFPNYLKSLAGITDSIINWATIRSQTIETLVEITRPVFDVRSDA